MGTPHISSRRTSQVPRIGLDYFFITEVGVKKRAEYGLSDAELEDAVATIRADPGLSNIPPTWICDAATLAALSNGLARDNMSPVAVPSPSADLSGISSR